MTTYPGGKNGSGTYQAIINQLPPHELYAECFLGSGAILRHKLPAASSIGVDSDADVLRAFSGDGIPNLTLVCADALQFLLANRANIGDARSTMLYLDPPYLMETRRDPRRIYRHEFNAPAEHRELLRLIKTFSCSIAISGYASSLYAEELAGWRAVSFPSMTRGGKLATEWLWTNYPEPLELHDYRYLGRTFRERERIKRQQQRWFARLQRMSSLQRHALMQAIEVFRNTSPNMPVSSTSPNPVMAADVAKKGDVIISPSATMDLA